MARLPAFALYCKRIVTFCACSITDATGRDDLYGSELLILLNLYKGSVELFGLLGTIYQCVGRDYIAVGRCQGKVVCNASSCLLCSTWIFLGCCIGNVNATCCVHLTITLIFYD